MKVLLVVWAAVILALSLVILNACAPVAWCTDGQVEYLCEVSAESEPL